MMNTNEQPPFEIERGYTLNPFGNGGWQMNVFVKLHVTARTSGLMGDLGAERWHTLCVLATFMDENGHCFPSVDQVARALKISRSSAVKRLQSLCEFQWNGRPIVTRVLKRHDGGHFANYRYTILPISQLSIFDGEIELPDQAEPVRVDATRPCPVDAMRSDLTLTRTNINENQNKQDVIITSSDSLSSKDILHYFAFKYRETYGVDYSINYRIEGNMVKKKLLAAFESDKLIRIIDTTMALYESKWASDKYPRPTIGALASWLANKVAAFTPDVTDHKPAQVSDEELDYEAKLRKIQEKRGRSYD